MDDKEIIMYSVEYKTLHHVQCNLNHYPLQHDESFFDYELLKAALYRKHQSITNFLLKLGCRVINPNETNSKETPLRLAVRLGNGSILRKILNKGASIYDKDQNGVTALYAAFKEKNYNAIDMLLNYCSSKNVKELSNNLFKSLDPENKDDLIHFHIACFKNNLSAVNKYLSAGFDVNSQFVLESKELTGLNPVHYAIIKNNSDTLNVFLKHNADLSIENSDGNTPLQIIYYSNLSGFGKYRISQIFDNGNDTKYINSVDNHGVSHFHLCCITNSPTHVKVFIDKGVDINSSIFLSCPEFPGFTPLHFAVMHGNEEVVKLLLANGADFNKVDKNGVTPLHLACELPEESARSIIKMLLDCKACTTAVNEKGHTPLHTAFYYAKGEETKVFDMLMSKIPWTVNFTDGQGLSHFHIVCARNDVKRANDLLKSGVPVDNCVVSGKHRGFTALHFAVLYKQKDVVKLLLKWKAQVNIPASEYFEVTPLHLACSYNYASISSMNYMNIYSLNNYINIYSVHSSDDKPVNLESSSNHKTQLDIINFLLLHGANVDAQDSSGKTPLFYVCPFGPFILDLSNEVTTKLIEIIKILLAHNANINVQLKSQKSILHFITENNFLKNSEELVEFLISKGADIHAVDDNGFTPLHVAVKLKNKELINIFLKHKANINAKTKNCKIPLQLLLEDCLKYLTTENKEILLILLENGSDVNVKSKNDRTPWINAIRDHNIYTLEILLKYGADINMVNSFGHSLLISALEKNQKDSTHLFVTAKTINILEIHILKLHLAGIYVSDEVRTGMKKLQANFNHLRLYDSVEISQKNFLNELDKMKLQKIDNYTSLYNILQKDAHDISKHVRNISFIKILEKENLDKNFPSYKDLLKLQFKKGLIRSDILESASELLFSLSGLSLPDPCCYLIFKYLTNEDILNLKIAVHLIKDCKRKRVNNYSGTIEPLTKKSKIQEL